MVWFWPNPWYAGCFVLARVVRCVVRRVVSVRPRKVYDGCGSSVWWKKEQESMVRSGLGVGGVAKLRRKGVLFFNAAHQVKAIAAIGIVEVNPLVEIGDCCSCVHLHVFFPTKAQNRYKELFPNTHFILALYFSQQKKSCSLVLKVKKWDSLFFRVLAGTYITVYRAASALFLKMYQVLFLTRHIKWKQLQ